MVNKEQIWKTYFVREGQKGFGEALCVFPLALLNSTHHSWEVGLEFMLGKTAGTRPPMVTALSHACSLTHIFPSQYPSFNGKKNNFYVTELFSSSTPTVNFSFSAHTTSCDFSGYFIDFSADDGVRGYSDRCSIFVLRSYFRGHKLHCQGNDAPGLAGCSGHPLAAHAC